MMPILIIVDHVTNPLGLVCTMKGHTHTGNNVATLHTPEHYMHNRQVKSSVQLRIIILVLFWYGFTNLN